MLKARMGSNFNSTLGMWNIN